MCSTLSLAVPFKVEVSLESLRNNGQHIFLPNDMFDFELELSQEFILLSLLSAHIVCLHV